jgi:tetratricopeptide (TPR) repeat protein
MPVDPNLINVARAANQRGVALAQEGRYGEALASLRAALQFCPHDVNVYCNLGAVLGLQGNYEEAIGYYQHALRLRPDHVESHYNLGNAHLQCDQLTEAEAAFRRALELEPGHVDALLNLAVALIGQQRLEEAAEVCRQVLTRQPDNVDALVHMGNTFLQKKEHHEAQHWYEQALRLQPDCTAAHNNLGNALRDQGLMKEAESCYRRAVFHGPDFAAAHNNLGVVLGEQGRFDEAERCYQEALLLNYHEARFHLAHLWLQLGDFERGWPMYEARWETRNFVKPSFAQPRWDGSDLAGRTLLIQAEQGLGDTIQFIRYAALAKRRGGRVVFQCQPALREVLKGCAGIDELVSQDAPLPAFDVHVPLLSLPGLLGTRLDNMPAETPYLTADASRVAHWRAVLAALDPGLRVGIAWQGSPAHRNDRRRSVPLAQFEPLARVPGVQLISLQVGPGAEQVAELAGRWPIIDLGSRFDASSFADAAAVISGLDLLVSVDTALVHLAGALGRPAWVALSYAADWRWLLGREDSPWYPTVRLFRQAEPGQWPEVFERVAGALQRKTRAV